MNVLVTGGAGFIGAAVLERLRADGHGLRVLDDLSAGERGRVPPGVELVVGDIRDLALVRAACEGMDRVIHQAALVSVPASMADPARCWEVNVVGTRNVLLAAREAGCTRVVLASSSAVYGHARALPIAEEHPVDPLSPYAYSKWLNELDAGYYARFWGLETVCLRYFNVFGPGQRPNSPYAGVIALFARRVQAGEPVTLFGTGEQTRDFVYVDDVAAAVASAATAPGPLPGVLNVGSGVRTSLLELVEAIAAVVGRAPKVVCGPPRPGDIMHSQAGLERTRVQGGYLPGVALAEGLARTLAWLGSA